MTESGTEISPAVALDLPAGGRGVVEPPARRHGRFPLVRFVVYRLGAGVLTLLVVSFLIFLATNALPGNAAQAVLGKHALENPAALASLEHRLNLDEPLLVRYGDWLSHFVQGDFGQSAVRLAAGADEAPISASIGTPLHNSLVLALVAAIVLLPLALGVGLMAGVREGKATDYSLSYVGLILASMPEFVLGAFLIVIFFSELNLLPPVALVPPGASPLDNVQALVLPVATLLGGSVAFCARQIRAGVVEVMHQDYVTSARLNGIRERRVLLRYALRNSLAPSVQSYALTLQYLLGGIVIVEALFAYPGVGQMLVNAVQTRDVTEVQAIALILAAAYIVINIVADLVVVLLVPKLRTGIK